MSIAPDAGEPLSPECQMTGTAYLKCGKLVIENQCQNRDRNQQELHSERVLIAVVCRLELDVHEVQGGIRGADENDLSHEIRKAGVMTLATRVHQRKLLTFISVLYSEMKLDRRSKYRVVYTAANKI